MKGNALIVSFTLALGIVLPTENLQEPVAHFVPVVHHQVYVAEARTVGILE